MRDYYDETANWSLIPPHMHEAIRAYVMEGVPPGGFLTAALANDLRESFARADDGNTAAMRGWCQFIYSYVPSNAHGTYDMVRAWCERGGLNRRVAA